MVVHITDTVLYIGALTLLMAEDKIKLQFQIQRVFDMKLYSAYSDGAVFTVVPKRNFLFLLEKSRDFSLKMCLFKHRNRNL